jgi:hypothetical protein
MGIEVHHAGNSERTLEDGQSRSRDDGYLAAKATLKNAVIPELAEGFLTIPFGPGRMSE